jgi:broad specificity polyphosphatase/5'/3'-nucleotidase SurE
MKATVKTITMGLALCISSIAFGQKAEGGPNPATPKVEKLDRNTKSILKEIVKIEQYSENLYGANSNKAKRAKRKIARSQIKIMAYRAMAPFQSIAIPGVERYFNKHDFDVSENSLKMTKFSVSRNEMADNFTLSLKTGLNDDLTIEIISPAGELLKSVSCSKEKKGLRQLIDLNSDAGQVYFVHIIQGGQATTKKVVFG